jgi:hypothetical protein
VIADSARKEIMGRLLRAVARATTADLQRAAMFLEWAWDVRAGCTKQRGRARKRQMDAIVETMEAKRLRDAGWR